MPSKHQKFSELIHTLRKLHVEENLKEISPDEKYTYFEKVLDDVSRLKKEVLPLRIAELKKVIDSSPEKLKISTFELMEQSRLENTHSNVLEYLFDYNLLGPKAANILSDLISRVIDENDYDKLKKNILLRKYTVEREKSVKVGNRWGRIDLFIVDEVNKFTITLENKIHASLSMFHEEEEGIKKTQLNVYSKYVKHNYKTYANIFLLLSFQQFDGDIAPFRSVELDDFFEVLMNYEISDNIFNEYKLMLFAMMRDLDIGRINHIRKIRNASEKDDLNLYSIEQMKGIYYEI